MFAPRFERQQFIGNDTDGSKAVGQRFQRQIVCKTGQKLLIKYGTNLDIQNTTGRKTALINAALEDNCKAMPVMIEAGADVNLRDDDGDSALDIVDDEKTGKLLIAYGALEKNENEN